MRDQHTYDLIQSYMEVESCIRNRVIQSLQAEPEVTSLTDCEPSDWEVRRAPRVACQPSSRPITTTHRPCWTHSGSRSQIVDARGVRHSLSVRLFASTFPANPTARRTPLSPPRSAAQEYQVLLKAVPIFHELDESSLKRLMRRCDIVRFGDGDHIVVSPSPPLLPCLVVTRTDTGAGRLTGAGHHGRYHVRRHGGRMLRAEGRHLKA